MSAAPMSQKGLAMVIDRWKVSSIVLGSIFTVVVAGQYVDAADAQPKKVGAPQKVSAPQKGQKGPVRIGPDAVPAPPAADAPKEAPKEVPKEGEQTPSFEDDKKGTPMERAVKVLEHAKRTLAKIKPDEDGHRDKALKHINTAISEARAIPKVEAP